MVGTKTNDRSHLRLMTTPELIERARLADYDSETGDIIVVLSERLDTHHRAAQAAIKDIPYSPGAARAKLQQLK